ncbi:hypothetical protein [Swingsia samuiensis]|uniref:Uncharacterized protein n=1 Tax=Swingsia samuiensis TaxID=1293412 RepID=A0A4Y6UKL3_9PROT|nr:hypothetical protein [Swingsia samuiensis]QDH18102.1 hypothetical protein E3D00_10415 [Swingsia samuiensis]
MTDIPIAFPDTEMGFDASSIDADKFSEKFIEEFKNELTTRMSEDKRKRVPIVTEYVIKSAVSAANTAVFDQTWQFNYNINIEVSAHKERKLLEEHIESDKNLENIKITSCLGGDLDVQIRIGNKVLVNLESELGGARQRAEDLAKLTSHTHPPIVSIMVSRGKSRKEVESIKKNISNKSNENTGDLISITIYWKNNSRIKEAEIIIDKVR